MKNFFKKVAKKNKHRSASFLFENSASKSNDESALLKKYKDKKNKKTKSKEKNQQPEKSHSKSTKNSLLSNRKTNKNIEKPEKSQISVKSLPKNEPPNPIVKANSTGNIEANPQKNLPPKKAPQQLEKNVPLVIIEKEKSFKKEKFENLSENPKKEVILNLEDPVGSITKTIESVQVLLVKAKNKDPRAIVILLTFLSCLMLFFGVFAPVIRTISGCAYPAYMSFKALKTDDTSDDRRWLVYWTVYGCLEIFISFISPFTRIMPYFTLVELLFLVWLYHDATNGSKYIYETYIEPYLLKHERNIDKQLDKVDSGAILKKFIGGTIEN